MERITADMLEEQGSACEEGIKKFRRAFSDGVEVSAVNVRKAAEDEDKRGLLLWLLEGPEVCHYANPDSKIVTQVYSNPADHAALIAREIRKVIRRGGTL